MVVLTIKSLAEKQMSIGIEVWNYENKSRSRNEILPTQRSDQPSELKTNIQWLHVSDIDFGDFLELNFGGFLSGLHRVDKYLSQLEANWHRKTKSPIPVSGVLVGKTLYPAKDIMNRLS